MAAVTAVLVVRCHNAVLHPILYNEDGTQMVAYYLQHADPSAVFRVYEGYVAVLPNLVGYLAVRLLPLYVGAYVMVAAALALAVAALSLFSFPRFRFVMADDRARLAVCVLLALFPLGNHALVTNLTFSIWNVFIVTLLLVLAPFPSGLPARIGQAAFLVLAVPSNPYSIVLVPVCVALLWTRRSWPDRLANAGVIVLAIGYVAVGVHREVAGPLFAPGAVPAALGGIVHRVVFEPVLGNTIRVALQDAGLARVVELFAAGILAGVVAVVAGGRRPGPLGWRPLAGVLAFVVVALTWIAVVGRSGKYGSLVGLTWGQRYFYTQQLLFLFVPVAYLVGRAGWRGLPRAARVAAALVLVGYLGGLNLEDARFFATSKEQGIATITFLRNADRQLKEGRGRPGEPERMVLHRGGKWDIVLDLDAARRERNR